MKKTTLKLKCLALLLFLTSVITYAQQVEKCATDKLAAIERQKNPALFDKNRAELEKFTRDYALKMGKSSAVKGPTTIIPTVIHVVHNGEAVGTYPNMSDVQLISAITNLNDAFKNQGIYAGTTFLGSPSYNSPMDVEFVLAKVKEDGSATTGIERHDVTSKSYAALYNTDGISGGASGVESDVLFKDYLWNPQDYMNIWIVKKIDGVDIGTTGDGTLGYATQPTTNPGVTDGLVCQARAFGYNTSYDPSNPGATPGYDFGTGPTNASGNGTADHEVGHYLNLHHTFNGDADETTCPPESGTVGTDDDGCPDIAPHIRTNSICPAENATVNTCVTGGGPNEYIHNFMNYSSDPCFTGFSNDQRTRVHAAVDGPRAAFKTSVGHVAPSGMYPAAVTNTPERTDTGIYGLGIFEVTLNGNSYKSLSAYNDGFYLNRVASQAATTLVENTLYAMTVTVGVGGGNNELVDVYIDYDNNGEFVSGERVYQTAGGSGINNGAHSFSFTTPNTGGFVNSQKLRMRVISDFDNGSPIPSSYITDSGSIEDYSVVFNPTLSVPDNQVKSSDVRVYPNPTNDILTISISNKDLAVISVYDALGRQVLKSANTDKVSVSNLKNGIYFLKLEFNNSNVITKRFIKN